MTGAAGPRARQSAGLLARGGRAGGQAPRHPSSGGAGTLSRVERRRLVARRRARAALVVAAAFGCVVLATQLPLHALLQQRADEARTAATVDRLVRQNRFLASQAAALANPSTVQALAHSEFDYVHPGQRAYDVVPPAGRSGPTTGIGHVQLGQPVIAPGSEASAVAIGALGSAAAASGSAASGAAAAPAGGTGSGNGVAGSGHAGPGGGFWSRLVHTLEFWS